MRICGEISESENKEIETLVINKKYLNKSDFVRHCIRQELQRIREYAREKERKQIAIKELTKKLDDIE